MNKDILKFLQEAVVICVSSAQSSLACKWIDNPGWQKAVDLLDECTDELRVLQDELKKETSNV